MAAKKPIIATVELGPNYVFHLMSLARLGFDSDYADLYADSARAEDVEFLRDCRETLVFADGHSGALCDTMIFLPSYLGLDTEDAIAAFFETLLRAIDRGDTGPLLAKYGVELGRLRLWMAHAEPDWLTARWLDGLRPHRSTIARFGGIYSANLKGYRDLVWPYERPKLEAVAARLNAHFEARDVIARWEEATGLTWAADRYEIVLCSAIKNGPTANSLGYERNVFYHGHDLEWMTQFISHEVGTHLLIGIFTKVARAGAYDFDLIYRAFENLSRFYNAKILDDGWLYTMPPQSEPDKFSAIYGRIQFKEPEIEPAELFARGLEAAAKER